MRPFGTKYLLLVEVLRYGPLGREAIATALGTPLEYDQHNIRVLRRHLVAQVINGENVPALFEEFRMRPERPASRVNCTHWQLTEAGKLLERKLRTKRQRAARKENKQ